jgi:hypothetical protein
MKQFKIGFILIFIFLSSCSENLDFAQTDDFSASPVVKSSLAYFTLRSFNFINPITGTEILNLPPDESDFRPFDNDFIRNNLIRVVFDVEVKNEITRDFSLLVELLDDSGAVVYTLRQLDVSARNLAYTYQETVEIIANQDIVNATRVRISVNLSSSTNPLIANDPSELEFKSSLTLFIETE